MKPQPIQANAGRRTATILVRHTGDRPIQVGSHYHFFEVNRRACSSIATQARGMRLNIAAGTRCDSSPAKRRKWSLVEFAGERIVYGHQGKGNQ